MLASKIGLFGGQRTLIISSDQTNFNLHTALGFPGGAVRVTVVVNSGVTIRSDASGTPAFNEGNLAAGSRVLLINNGTLHGMGGAGGNGGTISYDGFNIITTNGVNGGNGSDALRLSAPTTIINASGFIFGGGGGGSGGSWAYFLGEDESSGTFAASGGGGGGGGQGASASALGTGGVATHYDPPLKVSGTNGAVGGVSGAGSGGGGGDVAYYWYISNTLRGSDAGSGGVWGTAGSNPSVPSLDAGGVGMTYGTLSSGGAAGKAVDLNGFSVTWISGNDSTHVKGAVA